MFKSKKARVVRTLGPLLASLIIGYYWPMHFLSR